MSTEERLRSQREMRYGSDDRLYVLSRRIRTRNKQSAEWLSKRGGKTRRAKKLFKTRSRQDRCLRNFTDWLWEKSYFPAFPRIKRALEWRQDRMPFTIVVVTPLIAIMKDQVEHLNKIGVAAAMMGENVDEAVKSGSCEIVWSLKIHSKAYCSHKSWLSKEWTKGLQKESLESKLQLSLLTRSTQSPNSKFSLQLLCIFIAWVNDLYWNGFLSKWAIFVCHLIHIFFVTYTLKSCFKAVNKFIVHEYFSRSLLSESLTLGF